jgi:hypothetical protein
VLAELERLTDQDVRIVEAPFEQGELGPVDPGEPELGGLPKFPGDPGHGLERLASAGGIPGFQQCVESVLVSGVGPFGVLDLFRDRDELIGDRPAPIDRLRAHVRAVPALECVRQRGPVPQSPRHPQRLIAHRLARRRGKGVTQRTRGQPRQETDAQVVVRIAKERQGLLEEGDEVRIAPGPRPDEPSPVPERRSSQMPRRAGAAGELGGRQERLPGTLLIAGPGQRVSQRQQQLPARARRSGGLQGDGALVEPDRLRIGMQRQGPIARVAERPDRSFDELLAHDPTGAGVLDGAEVVGRQHLGVVLTTGTRLDPSGRDEVLLGATSLWDLLVRDVADERVAEGVLGLARDRAAPLAAHELPTSEGVQRRFEPRPVVAERPDPEHSPDDCRVL